MKLHTTDAPEAKISGGQEASDFTFKLTAQAVQLLSSGLYSDPRKAILRELACNAWDAHLEAGRADQQIRVSLPGKFSSELVVRDFGNGLSHKGAMNLYTTFFDSTKLDSNLTTGALGLGSKSPLGYTNNYAVISYQDGKARSYAIYIDAETGMPKCVYAGESDTTEPDGLEVRVPTKDNDHPQWQDAARKVFPFFPVPPEGDDFSRVSDVPDVLAVHDNVRLTDGSYYGNESWIVHMGNVAYPIDFSKLEDEYEIIDSCTRGGVVHADLGEVMFTPDRDSLLYNNRTIEYLNSTFREFLKNFSADINAEIYKTDTVSGLIALSAKISKLPLATKTKLIQNSFLGKEISVRGEILGATQKQIDTIIHAVQNGFVSNTRGPINPGVYPFLSALERQRTMPNNDVSIELGLENFRYSQLSWIVAGTSSFTHKMIFGNNIYHSSTQRVLEELTGHDNAWIYKSEYSWKVGGDSRAIKNENIDFLKILVVGNNSDVRSTMAARRCLKGEALIGRNETALVFYCDDMSTFDQTSAALKQAGIEFETHKLSDINIEHYRHVGKSSSNGAKVTCLKGNADSSRGVYWDRGWDLDTVFNDPSSKAWVEIKRYSPVGSKKIKSQRELERLAIGVYKRLGCSEIVCVKNADVEAFKNSPDWVHIDDAMDAVSKKRFELVTDEAILAHELWEALDGYVLTFVQLMQQNVDLITRAKEVLGPIAGLEIKEIRNFHIIKEDAEALDFNLPTADEKLKKDLVEKIKTMYNQIPLAQDVVHSAFRTDKQEQALKIINTFTEEQK